VITTLASSAKGAGTRLLIRQGTARRYARRTKEIGVRIALGAAADHRDGSEERRRSGIDRRADRLACRVGGGAVVRSMLFGLKPADPATTASAILLLLVAALIAAYRPPGVCRSSIRWWPCGTSRLQRIGVRFAIHRCRTASKPSALTHMNRMPHVDLWMVRHHRWSAGCRYRASSSRSLNLTIGLARRLVT
jgi:hypothetical protein